MLYELTDTQIVTDCTAQDIFT